LEKIKDLFLRNDLYRVIYEIKSYLLIRKKNEFSANLIRLYNLKPYYFGTSPYFSQDREFKDIIKNNIQKNLIRIKKKEINDLSTKDANGSSNQIENSNSKLKKLNQRPIKKSKFFRNSFNKKFQLDGIKQNDFNNDINKNILKIPFDETLIMLRKLNDCNSMLKRIDLMYLLRSSIFKEIDKFWYNIPLKMKYKSVDADNLLSIFIYLIVKSQMTNLIIDIEIIDCFLSKNIKLSKKGYFFSIFQSSIEYIVEKINLYQLDLNIKEYNDNLKNEIKKLIIKPAEILEIEEDDDTNFIENGKI